MSALLSTMLGGEFGDDYGDAREAMADRPGFRHRPMDGVEYIAVHHTAGSKAAAWTTIRDQHQAQGWAGIGYHIGIRQGVVSYLGSVELARANVKGQNHRVIGVVIAGDYTRIGLADEDHDALRRVVRVLDAFVGRELAVVGHGQVPGGPATACPGTAVLAVLPGIRQRPAPTATEAAMALHQRLRVDAPSREVLALNPAAGLTRAILADRYVPVSREYDAVGDDGTGYTCQVAQAIKAGRVVRRIYIARRPDWSVRYIDV